MTQHATREHVSPVHFGGYAGNRQLGTQLETNLFVIENAHELSCEYRLFRIRGLDPDSDDYEKNAQLLVGRVSRSQKMPAAICYKDGAAHLAVPTEYSDPPESLSLVRTFVRLDRLPGTYTLRFDKRDPDTEPLCVRFLQFALQGPLWQAKQLLWQPSSGRPFFQKKATVSEDGVEMYKGFAFRVVAIEDGPLCICVDVTRKYLAKSFLPADLSRDDFREIKGSHCVYHHGHEWYEIKLEGYHDLNVSEIMIEGQSLLDRIFSRTPKPHPPYLLSVPRDCVALTYRNGTGDVRTVPSALCRLTYDTESPVVSRLHQKTILPPHQRRKEIHQLAQTYLQGLSFNGVPIVLSKRPLTLRRTMFMVPDLEFGHGETLSMRGSPGARHVTLENLGSERLSLLKDPEAGFWAHGPLDRQYIILPRSLACTFRDAFLKDLAEELARLYPESRPYAPEPIIYNDDVQKMPAHLGREILEAVDAQPRRSGYALVMIPEVRRRPREEDRLAHLAMQELRKRDIHAAVIHTTTPSASYELKENEKKELMWRPSSDPKIRKRLSGYLRGVVINKILLLNRRWPFVLATPLHAQIVVGIDVKGHTAGFTFIFDNGRRVRFEADTSQQKEKLRADQVETVLLNVLREELSSRGEPVDCIVFHRQGKAFPPEVKGIKRVLTQLRKENLLTENFRWAIAEIPDTSPIHLRLFEVTLRPDNSPWVDNPEVGYYRRFSSRLGFVCTTGRAFPHRGCVRPVWVRLVEGNMPIESVMGDISALSHLAWTRPEDCSRDPLSIKMTDIRLREVAGEYDADDLRFVLDEEDEDAELEEELP